MGKKQIRISWLCFLMIIAIAGCDSTKSNEANNFHLSIAATPNSVLTGEFSAISATLTNVDTSVTSTGTSTTSTTPVSGYPVIFTITQNTSKCTLTVVNGITDASGIATAIYQAGSISGIDIIQANIDKGQTTSVPIFVNITAPPTPTATPTPTPTI